MDSIQVLIFNHREETVHRFSRHGAVLKYYEEGPQKDLVAELAANWFTLAQACIVAHHVAAMEDDDQRINIIVAVNPYFQMAKRELSKAKGKNIRYLFIFFDAQEESARAFVYQKLRPVIFANHPVSVEVKFHHMGFI